MEHNDIHYYYYRVRDMFVFIELENTTGVASREKILEYGHLWKKKV